MSYNRSSEEKRKRLQRKLGQILGAPVDMSAPSIATEGMKAYAAVRDDGQPGGGTVYVLDVFYLIDRELARQGIKEQMGADHVWFDDELTREEVRKLLGLPKPGVS